MMRVKDILPAIIKLVQRRRNNKKYIGKQIKLTFINTNEIMEAQNSAKMISGNCKKLTKIAYTVYICNWIFGLGVIQYPLGTPHPKISFAYSFICIIFYCCISSVSFPYMLKWSLNACQTAIPIKLLFFSNIILTASVIALAWFRSEAILKCISRSVFINDLMEHIGIKISAKQIRRAYSRKLLICGILIAAVIGVNTSLITMEKIPLHAKVAAGIAFCYPVIIMFVADMTFLISVSISSYRYWVLNKTLKNMLRSRFDLPQHRRLISHLLNQKLKLPLDTISYPINEPTEVIKVTKKIHLGMLKVCEEVNKTYGLQILLSIIVAFGIITGNIYVSYTLLQDSYVKRNLAMKSMINSVVWTVYYTFKISTFAYACNQCKENAIKTGDLMNKFYDEPIANEEIQSEIRDFNMELIQRPVCFSAAGYIALDTSLMRIMISAITTYLMILIQLGKGSTESK